MRRPDPDLGLTPAGLCFGPSITLWSAHMGESGRRVERTPEREIHSIDKRIICDKIVAIANTC